MTFEKVDIDKKQVYILGNLYGNIMRYLGDMMHGLKQLIQYLTRVTCSTSTLIDKTLTSVPSRVYQKSVISVGVSDHQLNFCTRKISKIKICGAHKYLNFCSLKNYMTDYHKEILKLEDFPTTKFWLSQKKQAFSKEKLSETVGKLRIMGIP